MNQIRYFVYYLYHDILRKEDVCRKWKELERSQWWSPERLRLNQNRKLSSLLKHACETTPYYRAISEKLGLSASDYEDPDTMTRFPLLDKKLIRSNYHDLSTEKLSEYRVKQKSTSGSTGENLFFLHNIERVSSAVAGHMRSYGWCGVNPFDRKVALWGASFEEPPMKSIRDRLRRFSLQNLFLSSYELSETKMKQYAEQIKKHEPVVLVSYPSPLESFAKFCLENNHRFPSIKSIVCSAEQLFDHQKAHIEEAFGVPVFNRYGSREFGHIAHECELRNGLHISTDRLVVEVLDSAGDPCKPGEIGELVITDLDNYAMPFIRYRIGDLAAWSSHRCACGRGLPMLEKLEGRVFDLITTQSGNTVSGTFWTILMRHVSPDIEAFQVRQTAPDSIEISLKLESGGELPSERKYLLLDEIRKTAPDLSASVVYVDEIPLTPGGKRRFVVKNEF